MKSDTTKPATAAEPAATTTPAAADLQFEVFPRFDPERGHWLGFGSGPARVELEARKKASALGVTAALDLIAAEYFKSGGGRPYREALDAVTVNEAAARAAAADADSSRAKWESAIAAGDIDGAGKVEASIASAKSLATRLAARTPHLRAAAEAMKPAAVDGLEPLLKAELARIAADATARADALKPELGRVVSKPFGEWCIASVTSAEADRLARHPAAGKYFA